MSACCSAWPECEGLRLDDKGRCCRRKPIDYKSWNLGAPHKFCSRCDRAYDRVTGEQVGNWAHHRCSVCGTWIAGRAPKACPHCPRALP